MPPKIPLQVLYDHQIFELQQYGGVSRYFSELISRFIQSSEIIPSISVSITNNQFIRQINPEYLIPGKIQAHTIKRLISPDPYSSLNKKITENCKNLVNNHRVRSISAKNLESSIKTIQNGKFDIFHPTYYNPYFIPYLKGKPYVLTVYDLIHEKYPELFPLQDETIHNRKILIQNANLIIAISENTKSDIIQFYNVDPRRVSVVYLGNEHSSGNEMFKCQEKVTLPHQFFLYVGDRSSYKNFIFTLEAITPILCIPDYYLVCCGGGGLSEGELFFIERLGLHNKILQVSGDDNTLKQCYNQAIALIYPSLYEGFGIPIIEAFHEGCPVITSNIPTSLEIAGEAALFFEPKDPASIQEALRKILNNSEYREKLIKDGFERSNLFSWEITAKKTKELYKSLISHDE